EWAEQALGFRRDHDTVEAVWFPGELVRGAHMKPEIRRRLFQDFGRRYLDPSAIHLHLIMVSDLPSRGRTTIRKIAARHLAIWSQERRVEAAMPSLMALTEMAVLR